MLAGILGAMIGIGAAVVAVIAVVGLFIWNRRTDQEQAKRVAEAVPGAMAKVIEIGNTNTSEEYDDVSVRLRLEITPEFGDVYEAISLWIVKPAHLPDIQVGKTIPITLDRANPKIVYPVPSWASQPVAFEYGEEDMTN